MKRYIIYIIVLFCLWGCKSRTIYVPVESKKTEYIDRVKRDSIFMKDSVFIDRFFKGDTMLIVENRYVLEYRDKLKVDTINITDSIQVPYPVVEVKEINKLKIWQIVLMCLGLIPICYGCYKIFRIFSTIKKV